MVVRLSVGVTLLILGLAACTTKPVAQGQEAASPAEPPASPSAVRWQGHALREVTSLAALPASVRRAIGADKSGLGGVAERGEPFNVGDAIVEPLPMRRFITAGHDGDTWLVAMEQGGIVHDVTAVQVSGGVARRGWSLRCCMATLAEVVQQVSIAPSDSTFVPQP